MRLKIWGVRGSTPTPEVQNLGYGGNTSCLEIRSAENEVFIFDAGSGMRHLGQSLTEEFKGQKLSLNVFLTHFHWDHIQGLPFFLPFYKTDNEMTFHASRELGPLAEKLQGQMSKPYFPVSMDIGARRNFVELDSTELRFGSLRVRTFPLNHPQGAWGYRIESGAGSIVYATDLEHGNQRLDGVLREYSQGADILIYDCNYTPEEYASHIGWGHSTWSEAVNVAKDAGVKRLILFHHDPWHNDRMLDAIVAQARERFDNTLAATEGWSVDV
jgi:phosphoribosyl 1,2-cyclic phosphodiesterase